MRNNRRSDDRMEELLRAALTSEIEPEEEINRQILRSWKESFAMRKMKRKSLKVAVAAAACVMLTGVTVGAAVRYLNALEVAEELGNDKIVEAFRGENAILFDDVQEWGDYRVTLLGITTGERIVQTDLAEELAPDIDSTYAAVAIEYVDGAPMPDTSDDAYGDLTFFISPLIEGLMPWQYNIAGGIGGGYTETVKNGVLYRIIECDDIMMFADRALYLCVSDTTFYDTMAYNYDEPTGAITRNENYEGMNLLFTLPIDPSRADPAAAAEYIKAMEERWNPSGNEGAAADDTEEDPEAAALAEKASAICDQIKEQVAQGKKEEALKDATMVETAVLTLKNGRYEYFYEETDTYEDTEDGVAERKVSGGTYYFYPDDFTDGRDVMINYNYDNKGTLKGFTIMFIQEKEDDSATIEVWKRAI